jgi:tRNA A-37 threonylcarbamoyl transferase component Bud32
MNDTQPQPDPLAPMRRLDPICRRFEQAWKEGGTPRIEDELAGVEPDDRSGLLAGLLLLEWVYRRWRGQRVDRDEYRDRFPDLAGVVYRCWDQWLKDNDTGAEAQRASPKTVIPATHVTRDDDDFHVAGFTGPPGYEQLEPLGKGGMGVVYRAFDPKLRRHVALKRLHTVSGSRLVRLQREAEALARLQHPHIVIIYGWEEVGSEPVLVLEYVPGGGLEERLRHHALSVHDAARLLAILARAVQAAHAVGIVHRDLKPANVLLAPPIVGSSGTVAGFFPKVSDFGLARVEDGSEISELGAVLGTADYMSPEQAEGRNDDIGPATDVWALGVILYRCLTKKLPFCGDTVLETLERVKAGVYTPPRQLRPDLPLELAVLCQRCLEKNPARRPKSGEMAGVLETWLTSAVGVPPADGEDRHHLKAGLQPLASPRRRLLVAGCIAAVLLAVLCCWLLWLRLGNTDASLTSVTAEGPAADSPAAEPLRIAGFRVQHLRIAGGLAEDLGAIGEKSFALRFGDSVAVDVKLSRPAYLYLVAFNADGEEQLLWPTNAFGSKGGDPLTIPPLVKYLRFPTINPQTGNLRGLTLDDEKAGGLQAIALLTSAVALPPYADYQAARGKVNWKKHPGGKGVWLADTEGVHPVRAGAGVVRGEAVKPPDAPPLVEFARQLKAGGVELVEVLAFPVQAKEGK